MSNYRRGGKNRNKKKIENKSVVKTNKVDDDIERGMVIENLPNSMFRIKYENKEEPEIAYLSGKMKLHRIRVLVGDQVEVKTDPYGGKGRIVKRLRM